MQKTTKSYIHTPAKVRREIEGERDSSIEKFIKDEYQKVLVNEGASRRGLLQTIKWWKNSLSTFKKRPLV